MIKGNRAAIIEYLNQRQPGMRSMLKQRLKGVDSFASMKLLQGLYEVARNNDMRLNYIKGCKNGQR